MTFKKLEKLAHSGNTVIPTFCWVIGVERMSKNELFTLRGKPTCLRFLLSSLLGWLAAELAFVLIVTLFGSWHAGLEILCKLTAPRGCLYSAISPAVNLGILDKAGGCGA